MAAANNESSFRGFEPRWLERIEMSAAVRGTLPFTDMLVIHVVRGATAVGSFFPVPVPVPVPVPEKPPATHSLVWTSQD